MNSSQELSQERKSPFQVNNLFFEKKCTLGFLVEKGGSQMSSYIDYVECPKCGDDNCQLEVDVHTLESWLCCSKCGFHNESKPVQSEEEEEN